MIASLAVAGVAQAQAWPSKPVRLLINVAPGGVADVTARVLGARLTGGVIDLLFDPGPGIPQAKAGKVRMIAIAGATRRPDFPDAPTLEENGVKGVDGGPFFGFYGPAGLPPEVVDRPNREVAKVMQEPVVANRFKALVVDVAKPMSPQAFGAYVRSEHARYAKIVSALGIAR